MAASHATARFRTLLRISASYAGDVVLLPTHPDVLFFESCLIAPDALLPLIIGAGAAGSLAMACVLEICAGTSIFIDLADALIPDIVPRSLVSELLLAHGAKAVALTAALPLRHAPVAVVVLAAAASGAERLAISAFLGSAVRLAALAYLERTAARWLHRLGFGDDLTAARCRAELLPRARAPD